LSGPGPRSATEGIDDRTPPKKRESNASTERLALGVAVLGATLAPFAAAEPAMSATPADASSLCSGHLITEADSGTTVDMVLNTCVPGQFCPDFIVLFQVTINVILPPSS
jgi:hypothetical protein